MKKSITGPKISSDFLKVIRLIAKFKSVGINKRAIFKELKNLYWQLDEPARYHVIVELIKSRYREALNFFKNVLSKDESELIRHEVAFGIGVMGTAKYQSVLVDVLKKDSAQIVRHEAAIALATVGNKACVKILKETINNPQEKKVVIESARYSFNIILGNIQMERKNKE